MSVADTAFVKKECGKCHVSKFLHEFYRDGSREDGRGRTCKACVKSHNGSSLSAQRELILETRALNESVRELLEEIRAS